MACNTFVEELARALGKETIDLTDTIGVVAGDALYRVTIGDFISSFGFSGDLDSVGETSAIPILSGSAPSYGIAKILATQGVRAQLSPQGAVILSAQLKDAGASTDGIPIIKNRTASTIEFRRIKSGAGIRLTQKGDSIVIENSDAALDNNTVIVSNDTDLPVPSGGVITLAADTDYLFVNPVTTSNRFVLSNNTILRSVDPGLNGLTYTGTGVMLTLLDGYQAIRNIPISCPNGTLIDDTANDGVFVMENVSIPEVKNLGTLSTPSIGMLSVLIGIHTGEGFQYSPVTGRRLIIDRFLVNQSTGVNSVFLDLGTSTFSILNIDGVTFSDTDAGQTFLKGAATSGNLPGQAIAFVSNVSITGDMAALNTISPNDSGWEFQQCNKIASVDPHVMAYLTVAATTAVAVAGTFYPLTGVFAQTTAQKCSSNADGQLTYNGKQNRFLRLNVSLSVEAASGTNKTVRFVMAKNGTTIVNSAMSRVCSAGTAGIVSLDWGIEAVQGDVFRVYVTNDTDTIGVKVNQCQFRVS